MKSPFLYLVLYCVASLAIIDAKPTSEHHNETERNEIDTAYKKDKSDTRADTWIGPFVKPFRGAVSAVDNVRKEIFISPGELFKDVGYVENMFNKYFDGCTLSGFNLTENGFATFKPSRSNITIYSLKIAPLEPGEYQFKYECFKQGQTIKGAWTVYSLRPYPIRSNAFFEFVHNLTRYEVTNITKIWDSKVVGIKRHQQPNSLLVYGLADGFQHDTILDIRMGSRAGFEQPLATFMLQLQDQRTGNESSRRLRRESNSTKRDQIRLWIKDFKGTISNKQELAQCVALQYGSNYLKLEDVHFGNDTQKTTFNAELPNRDTCKTLSLIAQRILDCPFKVMAYNLTCASGESRFGPKHFFNTTADPGSSSPHDSENTNDSTTAVVNSKTEADAPLPESESTTSKDRYPAEITSNKPDAAHSTLPTSSSVTSGPPPTAPNPANINPPAAPSPSVTSPSMNSVSSPPQGRTPADSSSPNDSSPSVGPPPSRGSTPPGVFVEIGSSTAKPLGGGFAAPAETSSQRTTMFRKDPESDGFPSSVSNKANGDSVTKKDSEKQTVAKWFNFGNDASAAAPSVADSGRWFSTALKYTGIFAAICVAICLTILAMASWHHHCCCRL